jgi:ketosteroid isomerase-like protein
MSDEQQIRELIERWVRAVQRYDVDGVLKGTGLPATTHRRAT